MTSDEIMDLPVVITGPDTGEADCELSLGKVYVYHLDAQHGSCVVVELF